MGWCIWPYQGPGPGLMNPAGRFAGNVHHCSKSCNSGMTRSANSFVSSMCHAKERTNFILLSVASTDFGSIVVIIGLKRKMTRNSGS